MAQPGQVDRLEARIRHLLTRGMTLGNRARQFIDAFLPGPLPAALEVALENPESGEWAPLLELVFFPDEAFQAQIEDDLADSAFQRPHEAALIARLVEKPPEVVIRIGCGDDCLTAAMPEPVVGPFVSRLRIRIQPERRITDTIDSCLPRGRSQTARVLLRNTRHLPRGKAVEWLCRFLRQGSRQLHPDDLLERLRFVLSLMEDLPDGGDMERRLAERRSACLSALQVWQRACDRQEETPMEALIMDRAAAPHIDPTDMRRQIAMIDTLNGLTAAGS